MEKSTPTAPSGAEFCSTRDAAELLGVSIKTAQSWVETGVLQAWKTPGGHRRIRRASVIALVESREQSAVNVVATTEQHVTILTVDDDPHMQRLYELQFESWDPPLNHLRATNGFEGLLLMGEYSPDVLITDLHMPGMDGFRMLEALRKNPTHRQMKIVVVSGLSGAEIRDRGGIPAGIEVFTKPVDFDRLTRHIGKMLVAK